MSSSPLGLPPMFAYQRGFKSKDNLGKVFDILLIDIYKDNYYSNLGLSKYFFTIVKSLLTKLIVLITITYTLINTINSLTLIY